MVFTYEISNGYLVYVGLDKYENEELIKFALPHDLWFHVDSESSAHVYLRLKEGDTLDSIPEEALEVIEAFEDAQNTYDPNAVSNEELTATSLASIASSLEYQNMMTLDDVEEV